MQNGISIFIKLHNILRIFINIKNITIVMIGVSLSGGSTYMYYLWGVPTLKARRLKLDLLQAYKILYGFDNVD